MIGKWCRVYFIQFAVECISLMIEKLQFLHCCMEKNTYNTVLQIQV